MSKKIKKIVVDSFRAYQEKQNFDFVHEKSGKLANLVVLYAPNGYGKTSFFDAVEWAITGKIDRISGNSAINKEIALEYGSILKNKNSHKNQGTVKIIAEDNDFLEVKTAKLNGRMKNDYRPGDNEFISEDIKELLNEKEQFCTTNLLAHDKITSFLQTYTAGQKFEALEVFWDSKNEAQILSIIDSLEKELEKRQKEINGIIKELDKEIKKFKFEECKHEEISNIIKSLNSKPEEDEVIIELNSENYDNVLESVFSIEKNIEKRKLITNSLIADIEVLMGQQEEIINGNKELASLKKEKDRCEKQIKILNSIQEVEDKMKVLDKKLQEYNAILNKWDKYQILINQLIDANQKKKDSNNSLIELQKLQLSNQELLRIKQNDIKGFQDTQNHILEKKNELKKFVYEFSDNTNSLDKIKAKINKYTFLTKMRNIKRKTINDKIALIEGFLRGNVEFTAIQAILNESILDKHDIYQKLLLDKENNDKEISNKETEYKTRIEFQDKINQLIIKGRALVEENNLCDCPLCHAEYENHEKLLQQMLGKFQTDGEMSDLKTSLEVSSAKQKEVLQEIEKIKEEIDNGIKFILETERQNFEYQDKHIKKIEIVMSDLESNVRNIEVRQKEIAIKTQKYDVEIANKNLVELKFKEYFVEEMNNTKQIQLHNEQITQISVEIEKINQNMNKQKGNLIEYEDIINSIQDNEVFKGVHEFVNNDQNITSEMEQENQKMIILDKRNNIQIQMKNYKQKLQEFRNEVNTSEDVLADQNQSLSIKINEINLNYSNYILRLKKILDGSNLETDNYIELLGEKKDILTEKIDNIDKKIMKLKEIILGIQNLKVQGLWATKKNIRQENVEKRDLVSQKLLQLNNSKKVAQEFIENRIDEYFDSEIINQIYAKIDPHPTMTHIKFQTDLNKNKNGIHIYTYDKDEDEKMSPVLYLSSAQVNILSLCIFLARVLTVKETTFNTIFMDDPIQHLDGINLLAFIDLLRIITTRMDRQIVISTHNENFYKLMKVKMDEEYYLSRFIDLKCVGEILKP